MSTPTNKIQLLRDMQLAAYELELAVKDCDWRPCQEHINSLLNSIKTLESIFAREPLPTGYTEKCTCLNCLPPALPQTISGVDSNFWKRWRA